MSRFIFLIYLVKENTFVVFLFIQISQKAESKETLLTKNATKMYSATYDTSQLVLNFQLDTEISYAY